MNWLAAALELTGKWLVGNRNRWGFVVQMLAGMAWVVLALSVPSARGLLLVCLPAFAICEVG